ncbi:MAG: Tim44-like domain-containing protein [Lautropia sp.]|nr:Tim44-like domain-containing protein [Lautropia sp.]
MKKFLMMLMVVLCSSVFFVNDADAKRVGGGRSVGKQNNTVQREAVPPQRQNAAPTAPAQQNAAANSGARRWAGPLAGLAAGLGLAALASALGFGEGFAVFLLILLMGLVVLIAVRMFMARSQANRAAAAGAGAAGGTGAFRANAPQQGMNREVMPQPMAPQAPVAGAAAGAAATAAMPEPVLPAGFDAEAFVRQAKVQFVRLQAAFDTKNVEDLREFTSPEMFGELNIDLMQRGDAVQNTDVVELDARLLGVQEEGVMQMASVYFSGMIREDADAAAERFEEIWNFTRPASGASGWVLAGIQQV